MSIYISDLHNDKVEEVWRFTFEIPNICKVIILAAIRQWSTHEKISASITSNCYGLTKPKQIVERCSGSLLYFDYNILNKRLAIAKLRIMQKKIQASFKDKDGLFPYDKKILPIANGIKK